MKIMDSYASYFHWFLDKISDRRLSKFRMYLVVLLKWPTFVDTMFAHEDSGK